MKMKSIARLLFLLPACLSAGMVLAGEQTNAELMTRIGTLETRVARMEAMFGPALQTPEQQAEQMRLYQKEKEKQERAQLTQWAAAEEQARSTKKWLNPQPWTKLRVGMSRQEVEKILGKPDKIVIGDNNWLDTRYHAMNKVALVTYRNGRLLEFVSPDF